MSGIDRLDADRTISLLYRGLEVTAVPVRSHVDEVDVRLWAKLKQEGIRQELLAPMDIEVAMSLASTDPPFKTVLSKDVFLQATLLNTPPSDTPPLLTNHPLLTHHPF